MNLPEPVPGIVDAPISPVEVVEESATRTESQKLWEGVVERFRRDAGEDNLSEVVEHESLEAFLDSFQQKMDSFELQHSTKKELRAKIRVTMTAITSLSDLVGEGVNIVSLPFLTFASVDVDIDAYSNQRQVFPPAKTIFTAVNVLATVRRDMTTDFQSQPC